MSTIELGSKKFWEQMETDPAGLAYTICSIDLTDLQATLQHHPPLRAWVNSQFERSRIDEERAKWELGKARASALIAAKTYPDPATNKPKTVAVLEAEVEEDQAVQRAQAALLGAQEKRAALKAIADALEDRKDMLIQIAAKVRQEEREH